MFFLCFVENPPSCVSGHNFWAWVQTVQYNQFLFSYSRVFDAFEAEFKGSPDQIHFIFESNVGKGRIRHATTPKLNDEFLGSTQNRLKIQIQSYMSDSYLSDVNFINKMGQVWTTLKPNRCFSFVSVLNPTLISSFLEFRIFLSKFLVILIN